MKIASLLMITLDRFEITPKVWKTNVENVGIMDGLNTEYLICDNGSNDQRIVEHFSRWPLAYHRKNLVNEGVGRAFNQLFLRSKGDYIAILGNDIEMEPYWLTTAIEWLDKVPNSGLAGFNWGHGHVPPLTEKFGVKAHWLNAKLNRIFGAWVFRRKLVEDLGLFYEGYGKYGIEDSDVNERVNRAGYNSFYIPDMKSKHLVNDVGQRSEYRKMKDESLSNNLTIFSQRVAGFDKGETLKCELPPMRDNLTS